MDIKKFFISIIKSLIVLLIATLLFSSITLDLPNLLKGVFGDIFAYASPEVQKQVIGKLAETCSALDKGEQVATATQVCNNQSMLDSMRENCRNYRTLSSKGIRAPNDAQLSESCRQLESGAVEKMCGEVRQKGYLAPDFGRIGVLCKDYKSGKIKDKEFFLNLISGAIPTEQMQMPNIGAFEKYNKVVDYLNKNKILYFAILAVLFILLFLLIKDIKLFLLVLSRICFSIGILIILPLLGILAYDNFVGIDTTPLLGSMFKGEMTMQPKVIASVVLLMFLRTYTPLIISAGVIFLAIGIAGKAYVFVLKRKIKRDNEIKEKGSHKKGDVNKLFEDLKEKLRKERLRKKKRH